jgi:membrane associated rhomboid family serine protease
MFSASSYNEYQPVTWFGRWPVYVTTIITGLFVVGMFVTVFLTTARVSLEALLLSPAGIWRHGFVWQPFTYPLIQLPNFFYLFGLFFFYWFGVDVERYLGRSRHLKLFALLLLVPAVVSSIWWKTTGLNYVVAGPGDLGIGFFIAFATLYPNLEYFGWVPMKWIAFAGIVLAAMSHLPAHDWCGLGILLTTCAAAFGYIRLLQHGGAPDWRQLTARVLGRRRFRVVPKPRPGEDEITSIDPLLDKIAKSGISSLSESERRTLERAREALVKRDRKVQS